MKTERTIVHIGGKRHLVASKTELGTAIKIVTFPPDQYGFAEAEGEVLATTPAGCDGLAKALTEMADKIRKTT